MIIILEGPDGSGKTTLARELCERFNLEYHHEGPPPLNVPPLWHYGRILNELRGKRVVLDRFALGERVYGPTLRGVDRLGAEGWLVFSRLAMAVGVREIICLPPLDTCLVNWNRSQKPELFKDELKFHITYALYAWHALADHRHTVFDYTRTSIEELTYGWGDAEEHRFALPQGMIGVPWARYLLVGEQVGDVKGIDLPFFWTAGSSMYLTRALRRAGINDLHEVAYVNVFDAAGHVVEFPRENAIGVPYEIIALGRTAAKRCVQLGYSHRRAPHPQYWMRFHYSELAEYARRLKGAQC